MNSMLMNWLTWAFSETRMSHDISFTENRPWLVSRWMRKTFIMFICAQRKETKKWDVETGKFILNRKKLRIFLLLSTDPMKGPNLKKCVSPRLEVFQRLNSSPEPDGSSWIRKPLKWKKYILIWAVSITRDLVWSKSSIGLTSVY